jgi:hypothetical protein
MNVLRPVGSVVAGVQRTVTPIFAKGAGIFVKTVMGGPGGAMPSGAGSDLLSLFSSGGAGGSPAPEPQAAGFGGFKTEGFGKFMPVAIMGLLVVGGIVLMRRPPAAAPAPAK